MENHALNAASEVVKRLFDDGVLGEEVSYDETVAWMANIIAAEYREPPIGFLPNNVELVLDEEMAHGEQTAERLRDEF